MPQVYRWTVIKAAKSTERKRWFYVRDDLLTDEFFFFSLHAIVRRYSKWKIKDLGRVSDMEAIHFFH